MESKKTIHMTIDGRPVEVEDGKTVLEAAKQLGIEIPTLCHHPELRPAGFCRICMVEITKGKRHKLVASCCYPAEEGLSVVTESPRIVKIRKLLIELLWPSWRQRAKQYGVTKSRFVSELTDCSLCGLCVRYCNEVVGKNAVYFHGRGTERRIGFTPGMAECEECRKCFGLCSGGFLITEHGRQKADLFD